MMIDHGRLSSVFHEKLRATDLRETHTSLCRFMCECLLLVKNYLPAIGRSSLNLALAHWTVSKGVNGGLESASIQCWDYIELKHKTSTVIADKEDAALRALLCVLREEPESEDHLFETLDWFSTWIDGIGNYSSEIEVLLEKQSLLIAPSLGVHQHLPLQPGTFSLHKKIVDHD